MTRPTALRRGALLLLLLPPTACGRSEPAADSARADSSPAPAAAASVPTPSTAWTVTPSGIGAVRVGAVQPGASDTASCEFLPLPGGGGRRGVSVMLVKGRVARVDVNDSAVAGVATAEGARIGDSRARIDSLYAGRVRAEPHKYTDGQYLVVTPTEPADSGNRIIFETDSGGRRVLRFRAGRMPEVAWVEGCS